MWDGGFALSAGRHPAKCNTHHTFPAIIHQCRFFCGADHLSHSRFHFEVENNSLQTFNPYR
ncbi:TPA_asm: hypothetical protein G1T56_01280 [Salmonella enterica subsp. enterica serovar Typhi str. CT18]|uniref:Uncharacterized protein n=1 Tax=Salmonella enterica subsp. enterica serovar Typhi str. CT18 TaxID=220341 RepID=A0A716GBC8_SALTI|nr:hypothetical protein [Salmonella enterica subsp. enterica serovar Typhi str. CT18]HAD4454610.1 hypothetical protein [Salmonella enterica subsp. enterica serovar Typhi str. CT18]HAD4488612.1 hypothetical protein [Salmonella enterica subsp. enterica serovar Typhi str. CT18]HAD5064332.1 hypothetical protein [Salmonella enterica subsp. enterica serovar Typhi str. CT18]HAD5168945.1 hypothetical protein [Salmonella enterica subsp. enterica serovar Typhi str. CT18]